MEKGGHIEGTGLGESSLPFGSVFMIKLHIVYNLTSLCLIQIICLHEHWHAE